MQLTSLELHYYMWFTQVFITIVTCNLLLWFLIQCVLARPAVAPSRTCHLFGSLSQLTDRKCYARQ